tara:strand:- start:11 stop:253 length:243 start_codon:yes stop_codon:yes gene_type:complete
MNKDFKIKMLQIKVKDLIKLLNKNVSTKWDFDLRYTFGCIVTEDGLNEHEDERYNETYTGQKIWPLTEEIENLIKEINEK